MGTKRRAERGRTGASRSRRRRRRRRRRARPCLPPHRDPPRRPRRRLHCRARRTARRARPARPDPRASSRRFAAAAIFLRPGESKATRPRVSAPRGSSSAGVSGTRFLTHRQRRTRWISWRVASRGRSLKPLREREPERAAGRAFVGPRSRPSEVVAERAARSSRLCRESIRRRRRAACVRVSFRITTDTLQSTSQGTELVP